MYWETSHDCRKRFFKPAAKATAIQRAILFGKGVSGDYPRTASMEVTCLACVDAIERANLAGTVLLDG